MKENDITLINGKIYTIDKNNTIAESIVIREGKIAYIGTSTEAIEKTINKDCIIDLNGKTVLPGFIESHVHVPGNAYNELFNINLFDAKTEEDTMDTIREFVDKHPDYDMYYGRGYYPSVFSGLEASLGPRKERLDEICPDKPMIIVDFGGHLIWLNSEAFKMSNITKYTKDVHGGKIEKDPQTGELWGTLKEEAKALYKPQEFTLEQKKMAVKWLQKKMNAYGYTGMMALRPSADQDPNPIYDAMSAIEREGNLTVRFIGAREIKVNLPKEEQIEEAYEQTQTYKSDFLRAGIAKFFLDGTVEGVTAYLLEPYCDVVGKKDFVGIPLWDTDELTDCFIKVMDKGMDIHIHAIGDGAVKQGIDALEIAQKNVRGEHRNTITHIQLIREEDKKRMANLNIIGCCNVHWHLKDPGLYFDCELPFLGEKRAENEYPLASLLDAGVRLTCSGDVPITAYPNPFYAIQIGVTRNMVNAEFYRVEAITDMDDPRWLLNKNERVSVLDMVRMFTINAAYAIRIDEIAGSLEVGKFGDMIIIDKDIFNIPPLEIEQTKILKTIFNGEIVYES